MTIDLDEERTYLAEMAAKWKERAEVYERALREICDNGVSWEASERIARKALEKGAK